MAKKIILAIFIIIILSIFAFNLISKETVDVYIDGENVSVSTHTMANINSKSLNGEICDYTLDAMNDSASNITTLYNGINDICTRHGLKNPEINIDSILGKNQKSCKPCDKICHRSHQRGDRHAGFRFLKVARVNRHRLRPTKAKQQHE